jgi:hypothetical protein
MGVTLTEDIRMKKIATLAAAALIAASGTYAAAQGAGPAGPAAPGAGQDSAAPARAERRGMSQDDFNRFVDARVAGIKAGLRLTADQERLWQPVEGAIRTNATERFTRFEQRRAEAGRDRQQLDFMQRLERRGTLTTENAQRTSALATAMRPLWDSFNEDQKRIAPRLLRSALGGMGRQADRGPRGRRGDDHGRMGMMQRGHGMMHQPGGPQAPAQPQNPQ